MGRSGVSLLRQHELPVQIHHDQPFQPVLPRQRLLVEVAHAADEEGADGAGTKPGAIDCYVRKRSALQPDSYLRRDRSLL